MKISKNRQTKRKNEKKISRYLLRKRMNGKPQRGRKRKQPGPKPRLYTKEGTNIETGLDQCDCLTPCCPGCFLECPKCGSPKCGPVCRNARTFCYFEVVREQDERDDRS